MKVSLICCIQQALTTLGARSPKSLVRALDKIARFMRLGRWMTDHGFKLPRRARDRYAVFDAVISQVWDRKVLYLEFGVFQGASMRYWSQELKHPGSVLHGFDSFEGLPESWDHLKEGTFTTEGKVPAIADERVKFFKGWFDQVLPTYRLPGGEFEALIINIDADLYSSAVCILRHLRAAIRAGTFLYFDDFSQMEHEPKAFDEFLRESGLGFHLIAATQSLAQVFFKCER